MCYNGCRYFVYKDVPPGEEYCKLPPRVPCIEDYCEICDEPIEDCTCDDDE